MLDARSNKDQKGRRNGDFLGIEQWLWLKNELIDSLEYDFILIGSGIQVLRDDGIVEENWSEFPLARKKLLKLISIVNSYTNIIILSGDIHQAEISRAHCESYYTPGRLTTTNDEELTSSYETPSSADTENLSSKIASKQKTTSNQQTTTTTTTTKIRSNYRNILWDITSSGLSHTFMINAPYKDQISISNANNNNNVNENKNSQSVTMNIHDIGKSSENGSGNDSSENDSNRDRDGTDEDDDGDLPLIVRKKSFIKQFLYHFYQV
jgi:phosphodiesterase/alkaline phosphatase D-like protein